MTGRTHIIHAGHSQHIPRLERALRILIMLSGGKLWTCSQLSDCLGVSRRTVFRDIGLLRSAGFTIISDSINGQNGYFVMAPLLTIATLPTDEEYLAFLLAIHHAEPKLSPSNRKFLHRLLKKLTALTPLQEQD